MIIERKDVEELLLTHGFTPVAIAMREREGQRPALLSVTLECEASAKRLFNALRIVTRLEISRGIDDADRFVVSIFGADRY